MIIDSIVLQQDIKKEKEVMAAAKSRDSAKRSLLKTISWRVIGTMDTIAISWLLTGKLDVAFSIGSIELGSKMLLYYLHERVWNRLK
ncbi:DUF2061 domain-containing protein [Sungkyunkwania multivorans]|uniref:DUF2061 domain-containing protein n=1 Tax=Sungkyunkwania multivorans TaxID=1173618 RepID=A0ABW3CZ24_9FLAO